MHPAPFKVGDKVLFTVQHAAAFSKSHYKGEIGGTIDTVIPHSDLGGVIYNLKGQWSAVFHRNLFGLAEGPW